MSCDTSRRRSPSTRRLASTHARMRLTSSSVRSRTRVPGSTPVASHIWRATLGPIPKMYVSETSSRFSRGMSTPAMRATSALPLLVARVLADDLHAPVAADDLALVAHALDAGTDLQRAPLDYL